MILAVLWIVYCVLHSLFASLAFKKWMETLTDKHFRLYRLYYTLFAFISLTGIILYQFSISQKIIFKSSSFTLMMGGLISVTGLIIMTVCIRKYFMQLSGLRSLIENNAGNKLMITGIHKYVRHPLYSGTFLFIWGILLLLPYWSLLIASSIITLYTLIGIRFEENKLIMEFGKPYEDYQNAVPMIIPRFVAKIG
jgi:protein-S-isoprenylcysteine O-methyltransferase Ste14